VLCSHQRPEASGVEFSAQEFANYMQPRTEKKVMVESKKISPGCEDIMGCVDE
jgi:hypothetical protein